MLSFSRRSTWSSVPGSLVSSHVFGLFALSFSLSLAWSLSCSARSQDLTALSLSLCSYSISLVWTFNSSSTHELMTTTTPIRSKSNVSSVDIISTCMCSDDSEPQKIRGNGIWSSIEVSHFDIQIEKRGSRLSSVKILYIRPDAHLMNSSFGHGPSDI